MAGKIGEYEQWMEDFLQQAYEVYRNAVDDGQLELLDTHLAYHQDHLLTAEALADEIYQLAICYRLRHTIENLREAIHVTLELTGQ